jgi:hypothetical protein
LTSHFDDDISFDDDVNSSAEVKSLVNLSLIIISVLKSNLIKKSNQKLTALSVVTSLSVKSSISIRESNLEFKCLDVSSYKEGQSNVYVAFAVVFGKTFIFGDGDNSCEEVKSESPFMGDVIS